MSRCVTMDLCCYNILRWGGPWRPSLVKSDRSWCLAQRHLWDSKSEEKREETGLCCRGNGMRAQASTLVSPSLDRKAAVGCEQEPGSESQGASDICWASLPGPLPCTRRFYVTTNSRRSKQDEETDPEWGSSLWNITQLVNWRPRARTQAS